MEGLGEAERQGPPGESSFLSGVLLQSLSYEKGLTNAFFQWAWLMYG